MDWDGNELLLSDILGTDEDVIYKDIEDEIEKDLLKNAIDHSEPQGKEDRGAAVWLKAARRHGDDPERGGGSYGDLPVLHFQTGKEDHEAAKERDRPV